MNGRERLLLDPGWRFHRGDIPFPKGHGGWAKAGNFNTGAADPALDDSAWRRVDLPHDFIVEGQFSRVLESTGEVQGIAGLAPGQSLYTMHGSLPAAVGWYRKRFIVPESDRGRRLSVEFDGVSRNSSVWYNGHFLGRHLSGYTGFRFDVTDITRFGRDNALVVRADATEYEGWFYEGGGIYRHAWLVKHAPVHVAPDGVFVTAAVADGGASAAVTVQATVRNDSDEAANPRLTIVLLDQAGRPAGTATVKLALAPGEEGTVTQAVELRQPRLWSLTTPHLYTAVATLEDGHSLIDETRTRFGVRTAVFDPDRGFLLNGERVPLQGVCCHQDHAGVGAALPDALQEYRIRLLKEMGCNAYRCSHNPPTPELLDVCDRLGMLVIDENRLLGSSPEVLAQLESLVRRDRNHPSVILWSLANEEPLQGTEEGGRMAQTMKRVVRRLDPTRLVTMAMNDGISTWGREMSAALDVQGCNYSYEVVDAFHRRFPDKPIVHTESCSAVATRGIYATDPVKGYVSTYGDEAAGWGKTAEYNWRFCLERPWLAGTFVWTGFDYRGEPTPYGWPCINSHFGIMDTCGFPKDDYYYYQAWWSNRTVLHVFPHWNWPGREGKPVPVRVHSNCDAVELFLSGRSLGRKKVKTARHLEWQVRYKPGTLEARGWKAGKVVAVRRVATTGAPAGLKLIADQRSLRADGEDTVAVNVAVVDARGRVVPVADNPIRFAVAGAGKILGVGNGDPSSHEPDRARQRRAFNGWCQVIVQAGSSAGDLNLTAEAPGLAPTALRLTVAPAVLRPAVRSFGTRLLREFECSALQRAPADVAKAPPPRASLAFAPVTTVVPESAFCNVQKFHAGRHGLLYIRTTCHLESGGAGSLVYGADGPVRVWVNGQAVDCRPKATNPAVEGQYGAAVRWRRGLNEILFGLVSQHGLAWGVYARVVAAEDGVAALVDA